MPCFACCQGWLTAEVLGQDLRPGHGCMHATAGGCGVYQRRPEVPCRTFVCSWLVKDSPLPDWMRPDLSGAIVLLSMPWNGETVISAVPVGTSIPERTLEWLRQYAQEHARPLVFYERLRDDQGNYVGLRRYGFGSSEFRDKAARLEEAGGEEVRMTSGEG